jgi:hypothetical protein
LLYHRLAVAVLQVVKDLMAKGYVPSWCTACYRKGRTGEHFMKIAKAGNIHNFCHPNSLLTLQVRHSAVITASLAATVQQQEYSSISTTIYACA